MSRFIGDIARRTYGLNESDSELILTPRSRFQFSVSLNHVDSAALSSGSPSSKTIDTPFERIRSISMPAHDTSTANMNQYNRKRIIQNGIEYKPITMVAYDTLDGQVEQFLKNYASYYYANIMSTVSKESYLDDIANGEFATGSSFAGFKLRSDKNYIKTLTITRKNSLNDTNIITLYNPFISIIDTDTLDYTESAPVEYRMTFEYEGYDIVTSNKPEPAVFDDAGDPVIPLPPVQQPAPEPQRDPGNYDHLVGTPVNDIPVDEQTKIGNTGAYFEDQQGLLQAFGPVFGVR